MIVLDLICGNGHRFEGWFASIDAYEAQLAQAQLACPHCADAAIVRLPSGPHVKRAQDGTAKADAATRVAATLAREAEEVGRRFPAEARRIHYGEAPARSIRGEASLLEAVELIEEGIPVLPLPSPPKDKAH